MCGMRWVIKMKIKKRLEVQKKLDKKHIIIIVAITAIVLIVTGTVLGVKYHKEKLAREKKELIKEIKNSYNKYVALNKNAKLYDKKNQVKGTIKKDTDVEIEKNKNKENKYFKIKGTNYYLFYKDVKKIKELVSDDKYSNYINLDKTVITKKNTKLNLDDKEIIKLNDGGSFQLKFIDNDKYYVEYLNKIFSINKSNLKTIKENKEKVSTEEENDYISVINYNVIANKCNDTNCVNMSSFEEQMNYLTTNGYYTITFNEYKNWLAGNIRLKKKAILLITPNDTAEVQSANTKYNNCLNIVNSNDEVKFVDNNNKTTKESKLSELSRYNVKVKTTLNDFIHMVLGDHVEEKVAAQSNSSSNSGGGKIAVLNYHFFYDSSAGEACNENICLDTKNFREQLDYLKNNGYKTLTIKEFKQWLYGEIDVPAKSVLITVDDGAAGTGKHNGNKLIPIIEEYNMHATLFLITGWWDINNYRSPNLDIQSHTFDMHNTGTCGRPQVICASHDELLNDLNKSINVIGDKTSFCFPFYTYDQKSIEVVKEAGFAMSFVGGNRKASRSDDKYKVPRYPIYKNTTMQQFAAMVG